MLDYLIRLIGILFVLAMIFPLTLKKVNLGFIHLGMFIGYMGSPLNLCLLFTNSSFRSDL
jgi:hypothetical protein